MNIELVSKYYHPHFGGIERVVQTVAEGVTTSGHDVHVLSAVPRGLGATDDVNGVPITRASSAGELASVPVAPTLPLHLSRHASKASIVHYHLPNPLAVAAHFTARPDAPAIATYHSDIVRQTTALRGYRPILNRFLDQVEEIVVTSPRLLKHSEVLSPHTEKCTVVPLSVDLDRFGPPGSAPATPVDVAGPIILFVGRLCYYKGLEYLLDAMRSVDATLVIAGDGPLRDDLETRAADLPEDRVHFLGRVPENQLHAWYDAADVFALPSVEPSEAFGVVQLEAMAYGTPVVNTALPTGVPWVSQDGETGMTVPPRDSAALADALESILSDDSRRKLYGTAARQRVEEVFSQTDRIENITDIYRRVVSDRDG